MVSYHILRGVIMYSPHGGRHGDTVLRGQKNSDRGAQLHRETSRGRHQGDSVTDGSHNVVSICGETNDDKGTTERQDPGWSWGIACESTVLPDVVDGSERTDGVGNVIGTVSKGVCTCRQDLKERIKVLGLVGVLVGSLVHFGESRLILGRAGLKLHFVNVDRGTVE